MWKLLSRKRQREPELPIAFSGNKVEGHGSYFHDSP